MDEKSAIAEVLAAYEKLIGRNSRARALEKKLADGTITMQEGAELNSLRARAFGKALSGSVLGIAQGEREGTCTALLREGCNDVDELAQAAQRADLGRQGLNLTPPTAPFEEDRARKIGRSLEDETVPDETIQRRARSATENMLNSQYDRNMKKGAETCASAGLKTYIIRDSGSGCCKWCDEVSGKFVYGTEPKDVYRRHDNCTCTVVYESGRGKQNVWSKQNWSKEQEQKYLELRDELKAKKMTVAPDVKKPVRLSEKDIQAIIAKVGGLTFGVESGKIISGGISGAISPQSKRAGKHAEQYYESVRHMTTDVSKIAKNTGYSEEFIKTIKNFIFIDEHDLGDGRISRFEPNFEMAQTWQRLIDGRNIQSHDLTLLKHEEMERRLISQGYSQDEAHILASKEYNYAKEAAEFYGKIKKFKSD